MQTDFKEVFEKLLEDKQFKTIKDMFGRFNPVDVAELIPEYDEKQMVLLFRLIPKENAAEVFTYLEPEQQQVLLEAFTDNELKSIIGDMFIDDTVDIIEEMPANVVERMLALSGDKRNAINTILNYPEDSAGSIMTLEYISLAPGMTIGDALKKVKSTGRRYETVYTCYVVDKHKLLGIVTAKDLLTRDDGDVVSDVMETNIITVTTQTDQEEVASLFNKYDFLTLPVVDNEYCLVGIVTVDDAMEVFQDEVEEDFRKMAAIAANDKPYLKTSVFEIWKSRIGWLLLLMISATFTGIIISSFEDALSKLVVLTAFIPMLMGTGGNAGSQASVTVIRGISLGEVEVRDVLKVMWKEFRVSLLCGLTLSAAAFIKVMLVDGLIMGTAGISVVVAFVVGLTLCCTVIVAKFMGCLLPIAAKKLGLDPAVMASPLISTICDAASLLVYFGFAKLLLPL